MLKNEDKILSVIRYAPLVFLLFISIVIDVFLIEQKKDIFENERKEIEKNYIQVNKEIVKDEIVELSQYIKARQNEVEKQLKKSLQEGVLNAYNVAKAISEEHKNDKPETIKKRIAYILSQIRFNKNRSYFIIFDENANCYLHPLKYEIQGKNLWEFKDTNGKYIVKDMIKSLKNKKETFISWHWRKNDGKSHKKIGFVKKFEDLGLYIAAGDFVEDFELNVKKEVLEYVKRVKHLDNKYIFIIDYDGTYLNHFDDVYIGQNIALTNLIPNNERFFPLMKETAQKGGGFVQYPYMKPKNNQIVQKTSYVTQNDKWKWVLGTGFYMDDFYKEVEKRKEKLDIRHEDQKYKLLILISIFTSLLLILSIFISKILEKRFLLYKGQIQRQLDDSIKKDNLLAYQAKMASMGEMIGNIAHQWRQPLNMISSVTTGIKVQKELGVLTDELENEQLDTINENVKYLSSTIDDFRNFLKPNKEMTLFKVNELVDKTLKLISAQYKNKNINIIKRVEPISLVALENELLQVFINILNNARDELLKLEDNRYIFINAFQNENNLIIEIKDNARGIKKKNIDKIFDSGFTTKKDQDGTGIGLFMSKEIIEGHLNGTIEASNVKYEFDGKKYKGALFTITIPLNGV